MSPLVLSVDLAIRSYDDCGFVILNYCNVETLFVSVIKPNELSLFGKPNPEILAQSLFNFCEREKIRILFIDGPQGWKKPNSTLPYRIADYQAKAPAKVCERGLAKPRTCLPFVHFSVELFFHLVTRYKMHLLDRNSFKRSAYVPLECTYLCETLPFAQWRLLGMKPLPSKRRCSNEELIARYRHLSYQFNIKGRHSTLSHDELQALVAGIAGIDILEGNSNNLNLYGEDPIIADDTIYEGLIACKRCMN